MFLLSGAGGQRLEILHEASAEAEFSAEDPATWNEREDFKEAAEVVRELAVTNDHAERGVALEQEYNGLLTKDEEQLQFLMQAIADHRKHDPDSRKSAVARTGRQ
ncbi:hypothetical protein HAZT_HAZT009523 [Hyalella azteca]|uniref:Uncharacterized protein n=1 Tax=Hyalella azteca TaxID=294128 RepID=A0A6A0GS21_HYAAZ|nr:hypothetical protein HAZT_HAZT009523 [Hyalella azteca]